MPLNYRLKTDDPDSFTFLPPPNAPVFEPSYEDFLNPLEYIERIRPVAESYGICKIIPPLQWRPPFVVNEEKFTFTPRLQKINELEARTRIKINFLNRIITFWKLQGTNLKIPTIDGKFLDLYVLYNLVENEGGFYSVTEDNKWLKITTKIGLTAKFHNEIKKQYENILFPYSVFCQKNVLDLNPKDFKLSDVKEEDLILRYADEEVKKKIEAEAVDRLQMEIDISSSKNNIEIDQDPLAKYLCLTCEGGEEEESMLLCDGCDDSYHTFCLVPPLLEVPKGEWRCPACVAKALNVPSEAYGFAQSPTTYTLKQFEEMANRFKTDYFNTSDVPTEIVEKEFWRLLSRIDSDINVEYGADLHSVEHGSGFPSRITAEMSDDPETPFYLESPWNLNNLPVIPPSVLGYIKADISGMKVPWMYVGMVFATFCWHNEDHWNYSINYLHGGDCKTWYGVPGKSADKFETCMKMAAPDLFDEHPNLLHQLTTILNPNILVNEGVPVFRIDQKVGEFVVTFPRAYHAGFNQGYNFAEAVNFAPLDWLPIGRECVNYYSLTKRENVFSHDELVCDMAFQVDNLDPVSALAIYQELLEILKIERKFRYELLAWGVTKVQHQLLENYSDDLRQCEICKTTVYISCVACTCKKTSLKIACYRHYRELCQCHPSNHIFRYRWRLGHLVEIARKLKHKCQACDIFISQFIDSQASS